MANRGNAVDIQTAIMALFAGAYALLLNWLRLSYMSEKKETSFRVADIHRRIDRHKTENNKAARHSSDVTHQCRQEIEDKMAIILDNHMTEPHIKELVGGQVETVKELVKGNVGTILAKITVLEKNDERQLTETSKLRGDVSSLKADIRVTNTLIAKLAEK